MIFSKETIINRIWASQLIVKLIQLIISRNKITNLTNRDQYEQDLSWSVDEIDNN